MTRQRFRDMTPEEQNDWELRRHKSRYQEISDLLGKYKAPYTFTNPVGGYVSPIEMSIRAVLEEWSLLKKASDTQKVAEELRNLRNENEILKRRLERIKEICDE